MVKKFDTIKFYEIAESGNTVRLHGIFMRMHDTITPNTIKY